MSTSGMHRRPFEGRHLVSNLLVIEKLNSVFLQNNEAKCSWLKWMWINSGSQFCWWLSFIIPVYLFIFFCRYSKLVLENCYRADSHECPIGKASIQLTKELAKILKVMEVLTLLPFNAQEDTGVPFHQNFNSILRRDHQNFPMSVAPMNR